MKTLTFFVVVAKDNTYLQCLPRVTLGALFLELHYFAVCVAVASGFVVMDYGLGCWKLHGGRTVLVVEVEKLND